MGRLPCWAVQYRQSCDCGRWVLRPLIPTGGQQEPLTFLAVTDETLVGRIFLHLRWTAQSGSVLAAPLQISAAMLLWSVGRKPQYPGRLRPHEWNGSHLLPSPDESQSRTRINCSWGGPRPDTQYREPYNFGY